MVILMVNHYEKHLFRSVPMNYTNEKLAIHIEMIIDTGSAIYYTH